jgi:hypothetical protein
MFATVKPTSGKSKRSAVADGKRPQKRYQGGRQRQQYTMEQDLWEEDYVGMKDEEIWDDDHAQEEDEAASDWDFYSFQQSSSTFPPCTTQHCKDKNIAHTHTNERCYKLHPSKGKGASPKGRNSLLFTKGSKGKGKNKGKGKGKQGKGKGNCKGKGFKGKAPKGLGRSLDDTCHFCKQPGHYKAQCPKYAALSASTGYGRIRAKLPNEKVYVYDLLEDSDDSDVCANCLSADCDWNTTFLRTQSTQTFVPTVSQLIAIGTLALLQWKLLYFRKPRNLSSMMACGTWSLRPSRVTLLSKELLMQTHETEEDYWGNKDDEHHEDSGSDGEEDSN